VLWEYDHKSVAEHTVVSYLLVDCSKVLTHQLVRHRLASYTQLSDRHSETPSVEDVILPLGRLDYIWPTYVSLLKKIRVMEQEGVDRELLRYLYPCGVRTSIIITANVREWLHIISERTCKLAQEEIRGVMLLIARSLQELYPSMTAEIGPPCVVDHCTHGSASCGEPYSKPFP
jgi:thymidylate synthase (FAD)